MFIAIIINASCDSASENDEGQRDKGLLEGTFLGHLGALAIGATLAILATRATLTAALRGRGVTRAVRAALAVVATLRAAGGLVGVTLAIVAAFAVRAASLTAVLSLRLSLRHVIDTSE